MIRSSSTYAHLVARLVEQQECQQPGHAPVAVAEGVDAEEVEDEGRDQQQRLDRLLLPQPIEVVA